MGGEHNILSTSSLITYPIAKKIAPILHKLSITPNQVTITNMFFRLFISYRMITNNNNYLLPFLLLTHFIDCLDGTLARMFNQTSKLGSILDSASDVMFWPLIGVIVFHRTNQKILTLIIAIIILSVYLECITDCDWSDCNILEMNVELIILAGYWCYKN